MKTAEEYLYEMIQEMGEVNLRWYRGSIPSTEWKKVYELVTFYISQRTADNI